MPVAIIPAGRFGLTSSPNRTTLDPGALVEAQDITITDDSWRKAPGATRVDTGALPNAPYGSGTFAVSSQWAAALVTYPDAAAAFTASRGSLSYSGAATASQSFNPSGTITVGSRAVLVVGHAGSVSVAVSDNKGNPWAEDVFNSTSTLRVVRIFSTLVGAQLTAADTITLTISGGTVTLLLARLAQYVSASGWDRLKTASGTGTATAVGPTPPLSSVPSVIVMGTVGLGGTSFTPGSSFTQVAAGPATGGLVLDHSYRVDSTTPTIVGLHDWWPDGSTQRLITATTDGKLYKDDGAGALATTTLKSGLTNNTRLARFCTAGKESTGNRKLFFTNGVNTVQVLSGNGATTADISAPPADWSGSNQPTNLVFHANRLWGFGNANRPHTIYASSTTNHEDFTGTSVFFTADQGVGERLYGGANYQGLLWLWKYPRGIFWLDDTDPDLNAPWTVRTKSEALGCASSPHAVLPIDDDVLFLSADGGFHLLSAVSLEGGVRSSNIAQYLRIDQWIRDHIELSRLNQVLSVWYPARRQAAFSLCRTGSTQNDVTIWFDFRDVSGHDLSRLKVWYSYRDYPNALTTRRDSSLVERPILGEAGQVYMLDRTARTKDTGAYTGAYRTTSTDLGWNDPNARGALKQFQDLVVIFDPVASGTLSLGVYIDNRLSQTLSFDATQRQQRRRLGGEGYEIQFRGYNGTDNEDFSVLSHVLTYGVVGRQQSR